MSLCLSSPAKLNLFLRIINRRPDGYHALASLFQAVSLCDEITLSLADKDLLTCNVVGIPTDGSNLVLKAADLFRRKTGLRIGVKAHLEKKIPHQAGLGGGSGNAATTLWGLNELCGRPAKTDLLADWASEIGSDISFFFSQGTAYCTGRGEKVSLLDPLPNQTLWIVKPTEGLSTMDVYSRYNALAVEQRNADEHLESFLKGQPSYFNDLEEPAFAALPALLTLKQELKESGFHTVLMSGSGTAFFCLGEGTPPQREGLSSFNVHFLTRQQDRWYETIRR
jgi:4-diphosphocytidyl-2-C-methyl-D-erythritol kinase